MDYPLLLTQSIANCKIQLWIKNQVLYSLRNLFFVLFQSFTKPTFFMKMKSLLLVAFFAVVAFSSYGQTEQGRYLIGGDLPFAAQFNNGSGVSLSPSFGYFIMDNFAIGGLVNVNSFGGGTSYALGPLARYYFDTGNDKLKPFGQAFLGLKGGGGSTGLGVNLGGGLAIFLNEHVALEPNLKVDIDTREFYPSGTVSLNLGLQIYMP
jgi:hypothetical protein